MWLACQALGTQPDVGKAWKRTHSPQELREEVTLEAFRKAPVGKPGGQCLKRAAAQNARALWQVQGCS